MRREFFTDEYELAHGRKPRGVGDWAFVPGNFAWPNGNNDPMPQDGIAWVWGSYADAKREVAKRWPSVTFWRVLS